MLTSQYGVLHTGAFSHSGERARIPFGWIEGFGGRVILVHADALAVRQGADAADQRPGELESALAAMAPMDEHPESCLVKPRFHKRAFSSSSAAVVHTGYQ